MPLAAHVTPPGGVTISKVSVLSAAVVRTVEGNFIFFLMPIYLGVVILQLHNIKMHL